MTFWGVEIQPEKPYLHEDEDGMTKLHLSQATLGLDCKDKQRTVVKCKVGDNPELLLCSLVPGVQESCPLDLLFDQEVTFTVSGAGSVHLTGYYMPLEFDSEDEDDYDSEDEDGIEFSEGEDGEDSDGLEGVPSSVKIVEVEDAETAAPAKKGALAITNGEQNNKKRKKGDAAFTPVKSEDTEMGDETPKKPAAGAEPTTGVAATTPGGTPASEGKKKKKKKNKKAKTGEATPQAAGEKPIGEAAKPATPAAKAAEKPATPAAKAEEKDTTPKKGATTVKKHPNGLEVEQLAIGKPDGKKAVSGKKVSAKK